jgi:hypothetical protein
MPDLFRARWAPLWLRRRFPGRWTQEEVDEFQRRARVQLAHFDFADDHCREVNGHLLEPVGDEWQCIRCRVVSPTSTVRVPCVGWS